MKVGYRVAVNAFLRALGGIYLLAFFSLGDQIHGLIGSGGILPVEDFMERARIQLGSAGWLQLPSILWWFSGDAVLGMLCYVGMAFSILLILGILPLLSSLVLWLFYLSLVVGGQVFLSFQWDNLLLEAGFLAILLSPAVFISRSSTNPDPPRFVIFLLHWLLFRLMFSSGYVKLASGDASWRDLSALSYHFWTQPLPTWTAWYCHLAPAWLLRAMTFVMFVVELIVPFLIFSNRLFRAAALLFIVFLQIMIMATGNYGFFNLLTMVLCLLLLDDGWFTAQEKPDRPRLFPRLDRTGSILRWAISILIFVASLMVFSSTLKRNLPWPDPLVKLMGTISPFRSVNGYGLFAVMTKTRPEIILEGSRDGRTWDSYEFPYKPGDIHRTPLFVAPHMPRLDWQMWFAALGSYQGNPWLLRLMDKLVEGEPEVLELLAINPFGRDPPNYVRAVMYDYEFSNLDQNRHQYLWWTRDLKELYCPVIGRRP